MDSLKQELLDKLFVELNAWSRFQGAKSLIGDVRISHHGLTTNITVYTPQGPRHFTVTLREAR